jgi:uncharacterized protein HemY
MLRGLGLVALSRAQYTTAEQLFKQALVGVEDKPGTQFGVVNRDLADLYNKQGKTAEAQEASHRAEEFYRKAKESQR